MWGLVQLEAEPEVLECRNGFFLFFFFMMETGSSYSFSYSFLFICNSKEHPVKEHNCRSFTPKEHTSSWAQL